MKPAPEVIAGRCYRKPSSRGGHIVRLVLGILEPTGLYACEVRYVPVNGTAHRWGAAGSVVLSDGETRQMHDITVQSFRAWACGAELVPVDEQNKNGWHLA